MMACSEGGGYRRTGRLMLALALTIAGCKAPAASVTCTKDSSALSRRLVLGRQLAADTVVETTYRPLRSTWLAVVEPFCHIRAVTEGFLGTHCACCLNSPPDPVSPTRAHLEWPELEADLAHLLGSSPRNAGIQLLPDGPESLSILEAMLDQADERIDVLMYVWDSDPVGDRLAAQLAARAGPHRRVRVLVDGGGNLIHGNPAKGSAADVNRTVCWLAQQPYVEVIRTRNPFGRFDHRKLVLIDGRLAWSGGRNFTRSAFYVEHDLSYTLAGQLAGDLAAVFEEQWREQGGRPAQQLTVWGALPPDCENAKVHLLRSRPLQRELTRALDLAVDHACHHVYLENPYFSDNRLQYKLMQARRRGADVRVVLTVHSDSPSINRANAVATNRFLQAGVRVYLYPGMTHVKALSVDGCWAYVGTGNFDSLSLRCNRELGVGIGPGPTVTELEERVFQADFRPEWEVTTPLPVKPADYALEVLASCFF